MRKISISEISKKPSILDSVDGMVEVINKKSNEVKGVFISAKDLPYIKDVLEELEYKKWLKRNKNGLEASSKEFNGLFDEAIQDMAKKL